MGTTSAQRQAELRARAQALLSTTDPDAFAAASKAQLLEAITRVAGKEPNPLALELTARALLQHISETLEPVTVTAPDPRVAMLDADLSQAHAREIKRLEKRIAELTAENVIVSALAVSLGFAGLKIPRFLPCGFEPRPGTVDLKRNLL